MEKPRVSAAGPLDIFVIGASGDLARKKILPALFSLFSQDLLPKNIRIFGYARSDYDDARFRELVLEHLTCRYAPEHDCPAYTRRFLECCRYLRGAYDSPDDFRAAAAAISTTPSPNRLFYLAVPPTVFVPVAEGLKAAGLLYPDLPGQPWSRVVVEKPFGRDRASSDALSSDLAKVFAEAQTYRIDHYLGKEMLQNLLVLRFANQIFKPLWNNQKIERIDIDWAEDIGTEGRGGYFDNYGIIRDVIQNHLTQALALIAMEEPRSLSPEAIRDRKTQLLKDIPPVRMEDVVLGQYGPGKGHPGYLDDPTVPKGSFAPTYAALRLHVENERWRGVPFRIIAGKALDRKGMIIRARFKIPMTNIFCAGGRLAANELIIRAQPDEAILLRIVNKVPGSGFKLAVRDLDLSYRSAYPDQIIPDAYESLLLEVINGRGDLFIRDDELKAAWDIYTPLLQEIERTRAVPLLYPFGSAGPETTNVDAPCFAKS